MSPKDAEKDSLVLDFETYLREYPENTLKSLKKYRIDTSTYIAGEMGWLRRGHGTNFIGWSGQGKTVLIEQVGIYLASGLDLFGKIKVFKPVKVLLIECENGRDVIKRDIESMVKYTKADEKLVSENLVIIHNWKYQNESFHEFLRYCVLKHNPDVLIIDNFQGHCSGDINSTEVFNEWISPVMRVIKNQNCALILVDHASKPPKVGNTSKDFDFNMSAYLSSGTGRKTNWARTSFELINFVHDGRYRLNFSKSGQWAGIKDPDGKPTRHFFLEQSPTPNEPYWQVAQTQAPVVRGGKKDEDLKEFKKLYFVTENMTQGDWAKHFNVDLRTVNRWVKDLKAAKEGKMILRKKKK